ncbi:streptomycin biosynthesis protein [Streptomyces sp. NPDC001665]
MTFQPIRDAEHSSLSLLEDKLSPVTKVPIRTLLSPDSPRLHGESDAHAQVLAESEDDFPPIIAHRETMRVIDGAHRLRAAVLRGESEILVRFFDGNESDAFVLAVKANIKHGLPLSRADRRAAAERIIASHPHWSDRAIASSTGLAAKTVGAIRRATADIPQLRARVGRDGRTRPLDAADGRRRATALIRENPAASMRQIAVAARISQGTARDVRDRLARGEDPVAPQRRRSPQPKQQQFRGGGLPRDRQFTALASSPENRALLLERIKQDPSIRFTETGRTLIRLLDLHSLGPRELRRLVDTAPAHWRGTIAELVQACAEMWQELASLFDQGACAGSHEAAARD